jgi:hypothetical protein
MKIHNGYIFLFGLALLIETLLLVFVKGTAAKYGVYISVFNAVLIVYGFIYGKFRPKKKVLPK